MPPHHSSFWTTAALTSFALPPAGSARVAPHRLHGITVDARSKMICSFPQSRQDTCTKLLILFTSVNVCQVELLRPLALWSVSLSSFSAPVQDVDPASGLLATIWLRTRESTVTSGDLSESPLTPLQLTRSSLLDSLDVVQSVLARSRAVSLDLSWPVNHSDSSSPLGRLAHRRFLYERVVRQGDLFGGKWVALWSSLKALLRLACLSGQHGAPGIADLVLGTTGCNAFSARPNDGF